LTTTHAIYDLRSHAYEQYGGPIKRQIDEVFANNDRQWTQRALTQLPLLDSFIKESQRLHALSATLSSRYVSPAEGYTLKTQSPLDPDLYFAQGTQLATPLWGVHMDADHYPEPFKFDGFRFAKDEAPSSIPSDKFMAFGHGQFVNFSETAI
jgi:cytochrome P450